MDGEGVTWFGTLDVERARLWVHEREFDHPADEIVGPTDPPGEGVLGPHLQHRARPHRSYRPDTAECPRELGRVRPVRDDLELRHQSAPKLASEVSAGRTFAKLDCTSARLAEIFGASGSRALR
jgi:hypothetical protein